MFLWTATTEWVQLDTKLVKLDSELWNTLVFFGGAGGIVLLLLCPNYALGAFLLLAAYGVPLGIYIRERNSRVPESAKVLTPQHLVAM